jgi:hypothetical protein
VSGGWDIADPDLRKKHNKEILNGQEVRIYDAYQAAAAVHHVHDVLLPRISGADVTLVYGEKDSLIVSTVFEDLARQLTSGGNTVHTVVGADSAHNIFIDADSSLAEEAVAAAVRRARATDPVKAAEEVVDGATVTHLIEHLEELASAASTAAPVAAEAVAVLRPTGTA